MDNSMFWDSLSSGLHWTVEGVPEKRRSSKFWLIPAPSGRVMLKNWIGLFLAAVDVYSEQKIFPIQPVQYSKKQSLRFEVFFRNNMVAFRAYNGLFLARTFRGFNTLEAAKFFPDETCCFLPQIGDTDLPVFEILSVVPNDLSQIHCHQYFVDKQVFYNPREIPTPYTFGLTWVTNSIDRVTWNHLWGLGLPSSCSFKIEDATPIVRYTENNEQNFSLVRPIDKFIIKRVEVPPKTKAVATLWVDIQHNVVLPFVATVQKVKNGGFPERFYERGAWRGMVYKNLRIEVTMEPICQVCTIM
ncbi:uncharacterized protein LOC112541894 [Python bivittatus]|uniref:Uncharacterized protein LOC112541894 n=1 Tax=Python bivittatus TaxID=176946 RepID=A0A9F5J7H8_PYTBI|nr:uncharacterized protein LOC112541894 [Python bivittatus]